MDKEDGTQEIEQRVQWSAPAWAASSALYSISCVQSSLSTGYVFEEKFMRIFRRIFKMLLNWAPEAEDQALLHASSGGEHGV